MSEHSQVHAGGHGVEDVGIKSRNQALQPEGWPGSWNDFFINVKRGKSAFFVWIHNTETGPTPSRLTQLNPIEDMLLNTLTQAGVT